MQEAFCGKVLFELQRFIDVDIAVGYKLLHLITEVFEIVDLRGIQLAIGDHL